MLNLRLFKTLFFIGFITVFISSCGDKKKTGSVISGIDAEILNLTDSTVHLVSVVSPLDEIKGKSPQISIDIEVDSNGIFARPIEVTEGYYYFEYDQNRTLYFIQVGKKLSLDFDATKPIEKPEYSGKLKYESRYLFDRYLAHANFIANENKYFQYTEDEFVEVVELMRGKMDTMLVMYIANHPTGSQYFMQQESLTNLYFMASYLEAYPMQRNPENYENQPLSKDYYTNINTLNLNDTNAVNNPEFYAYIQNYVRNRAGIPNNKANVISQIELVNEKFTVSVYKDYLRFNTAREVAKWEDNDVRENVLDTLIYLISDNEIRQYLIQNIQSDTASIPQFENVILEDQ